MDFLKEDRFGKVYTNDFGLRNDIGTRDYLKALNPVITGPAGAPAGLIKPFTNDATLGSFNNGYFVPDSPFGTTIIKKGY